MAGFDETGLRVEGKLRWVHCARTGKYTLLSCHPRRGTKAMDAMGVLASFAGVAVHDAWAPYDTYAAPGHQLCCAHAVSELQAVADLAPAGEWCWATQAAEALAGMQRLVSLRDRAALRRHRPGRAGRAGPQLPLRGPDRHQGDRRPSGTLMKKHNALARRLIDRQDDYLRFTLGLAGATG